MQFGVNPGIPSSFKIVLLAQFVPNLVCFLLEKESRLATTFSHLGWVLSMLFIGFFMIWIVPQPLMFIGSGMKDFGRIWPMFAVVMILCILPIQPLMTMCNL